MRGRRAGQNTRDADDTSPPGRLSHRLVWPIVVAAEREGCDRASLMKQAGIDAGTDLAAPDVKVPRAQYFGLWESAIRATRRPGFPLRAATALGPESFGVIGFACLTSRTLGEAFHRAARFHAVWTADSRWYREDLTAGAAARAPTADRDGAAGPRACALVFEHDGSPRLGRDAAVEFALAEMIHHARAIAGIRIEPIEIRFQHACRDADEEDQYRAFFGGPLRWGATRNELVMDADFLDRVSPKADPHLLAFFEKQAGTLLARVPQERAFSESVRREIAAALPSGTPSLTGVARTLGTTERTLRRRLADEQTTFQLLLESCRSELADRYVQRRDLALSEVAFLLGFSEPSPFYRAFRRWFGLSPERYRQRLAAVPGAGTP
jgi:AraC-like DNA-binding protein